MTNAPKRENIWARTDRNRVYARARAWQPVLSQSRMRVTMGGRFAFQRVRAAWLGSSLHVGV